MECPCAGAAYDYAEKWRRDRYWMQQTSFLKMPFCQHAAVCAWPGKKSFNSGDKQNVTIDSPVLKVLFSYLGKKHKPDHPWNGYKAYSLKQGYKINHPWQAEQ